MITVLGNDEYHKISELAGSVNLDEKIDFRCTFLAAQNGSTKLLGVAGVSFRHKYPRFKHIIVRKEYQRTRLAFRLMKEIEKLLMEHGFDIYVALIPKTNKLMQKYAIKFGFKEYDKYKDSLWFYKKLKGD